MGQRLAFAQYRRPYCRFHLVLTHRPGGLGYRPAREQWPGQPARPVRFEPEDSSCRPSLQKSHRRLAQGSSDAERLLGRASGISSQNQRPRALTPAAKPRASAPGWRSKPTISQTMRFSDKICLVTGGGSGIGRACCERFTREGARVVVVDLREDHGNQTLEAIKRLGGEAIFAKADVGNSIEIKASVDVAVKQWGRIDVLVNDAAIMTFNPILELAEEDWEKVLHVNLKAVFLYCK